MVPAPRDTVTDRARARRAVRVELSRIRRYCDHGRLLDANAAIIRLRRYRHVLDWDAVIDAVVDLLADECPEDIWRFVLEEADVA